VQIQRQILEVTNRCLVIEVPESFLNRRAEIIVQTIDESRIPITSEPKRKPHPTIAGKGKTLEDLIRPVADEADWEMPVCDINLHYYEIINNKYIRM